MLTELAAVLAHSGIRSQDCVTGKDQSLHVPTSAALCSVAVANGGEGGREGGLRTEIPKQGARTEVREETRDWLQCEATVATLSFHHYDTIAETGRQGKPFCFASVAC